MRTILASLSTPLFLHGVLASLRSAVAMFYETFWPLILGFGLAGVIQSFVSRAAMERSLGTHRPRAIARAAFYGAISSSCSYAASAMTRSLFAKGADFTSALVFLVASTNLVFELGVVLTVLMGWQFAMAEYLGGCIMIVLLALLSVWWFGARDLREARSRAETFEGSTPATSDHEAFAEQSWSRKIRSKGAWADAAAYTLADLTMLRRELLIGYLVAGALATEVPPSFWNILFVHGHGAATGLENVLVGPLIAIASFVCSIGNVPLAAALWHGGISFGGVISFLFSDLITLPLLLIYQRYYGRRVTLKILGLFWLVMSFGGIVTEGIFRLAGILPTKRPVAIVPNHWRVDLTFFLNLLALVLFLLMLWLAQHRLAWGGGRRTATDPVCGMEVDLSHVAASTIWRDQSIVFCSERCRLRFVDAPERFAPSNTKEETMDIEAHSATIAIDPICGMSVDPDHAAGQETFDNVMYYFCSEGCARRFAAEPGAFTSS